MTATQRGTTRIFTFGDSLTQGGAPPCLHPMKYQYWMLRTLADGGRGIAVDLWNHGIGGQVAHEIVERIPAALAADLEGELGAPGASSTVLVLMGGTNDAWRYSDWDEELAKEMQVDVVEELARGVQYALDGGIEPARVLLCSVPPVGNVPTAPKYMKWSIGEINSKLEELAGRRGITFCDVHEAMRGTGGHADPACVVEDGVHFTEEGNRRCGERVARDIARSLGFR
ncbi:MAG: SGNH/GDSL hydrolase family protein [Promethearchaeota archaeon]